jgi:hypothetical protein
MDTLCIPVGSNERAYRLAQIDSMASIYSGASYSLVLDAELSNIVYVGDSVMDQDCQSPHRHSRHNLFALLACSTWATRSWTLQEGRLPKKVAFQFYDSIVVLGGYDSGKKEGNKLIEEISTPRKHRYPLHEDAIPIVVIGQPHSPGKNPVRRTSDPTQPLLAKDCCCADMVLERAFYSTFIGPRKLAHMSDLFAETWDELAGRSTTMPEDVPLILTNMMNLLNNRLVKLHDAGDMYQTILLSLRSIPMAVFYNMGPRQEISRHHLNRWVPTEIGSFGMSRGSRLWWEIKSDCFELEYTERVRNQKTYMYIVGPNRPLKSGRYLKLGPASAVYRMTLGVDSDDGFDFNSFASACFLIEHRTTFDPSQAELSKIYRGACFYVHHGETVSNRDAGCTDVNMTFYCPLRLEKVTSVPSHDHALEVYEPITTSCTLRVKYGMYCAQSNSFRQNTNSDKDSPPGFKRLRVRMDYNFEPIALLVVLPIYVLVISTLFWIWQPCCECHLILCELLLVVAIGFAFPVMAITIVLGRDIGDWYYTRSSVVSRPHEEAI